MSQDVAERLWEEIRRRIKEGDINRPLWRAVDAAKPIRLEGTTLVIGYEPEDYREAEFLDNPANRPFVQSILGSVASKPLRLLPIDGTTEHDYAHWKRRQAAKEALQRGEAGEDTPAREREPEPEPSDAEVEYGDIDNVQRLVTVHTRNLHLRWSHLRHRTYPMQQALFLDEALAELIVLERRINELAENDDNAERQLNRCIENLAKVVDMSPLHVAIEYSRFRRPID